MSRRPKLILCSQDAGLIAHWQRALGTGGTTITSCFQALHQLKLDFDAVVWVDLSLPDVPAWSHENWSWLLKQAGVKVVAASSNPKDNEAIQWLDIGCAAYCHAYSDAATLIQIQQVIRAGHVWIGQKLMQSLIHHAGRVAPLVPEPVLDWDTGLTQRERQVAILAANGASNHGIALDRGISERTVKAHLSAVFVKLNITDRLQLALRVHGIH